MRVFTFLAFTLAVIFMIALDIVLFEDNVMYGIGGIYCSNCYCSCCFTCCV